MICLPAVTGNCCVPCLEPSRTDIDSLYLSTFIFSSPRGVSVGREHGRSAGTAALLAALKASQLILFLFPSQELYFFCFSFFTN